ncbi:hypothetical protein L1987_67359 [Smallanthus sonchifolius]|uniref:Uncharacterized protein n=1 Tax=Smallanthus sonchifolius TaxID=185202 RepID=A0ACB9B3S9_9ASTR|nr:hypothetical protein L1987_67359 [Smallanthus sonchifolius]
MADFVHEDMSELILIRSDVKDLIRCQSVCKSWYSLITSPRFINRHLNHSYNKDLFNNELGHRRIILLDDDDDHQLVGSSNGLVSAFSSKLLVGNPLTREVRHLNPPPWISLSLSWGFGYDSTTDDYKVIVGAWKGENQTCVQVLSLKSNVWRVIGEVKYIFVSEVGILFNDALHWIVRDENDKKLIISFDLSTNEFKEIPQPGDVRYECTSGSRLGIVKERLCIYRCEFSCVDIWLMKNYDVKQSWELLRHDHEMKYDIVHYLRTPPPPNDGSLFHPDKSWLRTLKYIDLHWDYIHAPLFVQSLVSPHVNVNH